ncbi:BLUF domain-containing protein [Sphingomonas tabacisoli]|uniref:BLUF domain-containing protein n=1 Tax=Sphingomonas tabacisoli TaxID=2249466 RepID=A0ABW4I2G7_9SPHN
MIQLCYISTARPGHGWEAVDAILASSRRNNRRRTVTGLLLFNGKRFLQLLEGPEAQVRETFARIQHDPRHFAIVKLSERRIDEREFGAWDMSFERFEGDENKLRMIEQVKGLTARSSPSVRALFTSYAAI